MSIATETAKEWSMRIAKKIFTKLAYAVGSAIHIVDIHLAI
jgi:hypothetical protein